MWTTTLPNVEAAITGDQLGTGDYFSDVTVTITASDTCGNVAQTIYNLDGAFTLVNGGYASLTVSTTGSHTVLYSAKDGSGNLSPEGSLGFTMFAADSEGVIALIRKLVVDGLIAPQMETSLVSQVQNGALGAFINHVSAQAGKKIDAAIAVELIEIARAL